MERLSCCTFFSLFGLLFIVVPVSETDRYILMKIRNPIYKRDFLRTIFIRSTRYACYFAIFIAFEIDFCFFLPLFNPSSKSDETGMTQTSHKRNTCYFYIY